MQATQTNLTEVIVSTGAEKIIRKAIENIDKNYPSNDFMMDGITRIYRTEIDSPKYYKYFTSDAVLKIFYPSYTNHGENPKVSVKQNKIVFSQPDQAAYEPDKWVSSYMVNDFVHKQSEFIDPANLNDFSYKIIEKVLYNNSRVWIIDFHSKKQMKVEGTLFIDTASYAFVYADYNYYNVRKILHRPIVKSHHTVSYKKVGSKWYLNTSNIKTSYLSSRAKISSSKDFVCLGIDSTLNPPPLNNKDIVHDLDEDLKILKPTADSNWVYYDSIFKRAETDNIICYIQPPVKSISEIKKGKEPIDEDDIPFNKRIGFLEEARIKLILSLNRFNIRASKNFKGSSGVGLGSSIKISNHIFFITHASMNFGNGNGATSTSGGFYLTYSMNINTHFHPIYLAPFCGYTLAEILENKIRIKVIKQISTGATISASIRPNLRPFVTLGYNSIVKESGSLQNVYKSPVNFSTGIYFTLK